MRPDNPIDRFAEQEVRVQKAGMLLPERKLEERELYDARKRIREFMEEHGLSDADIARGIRVSSSQVSWFFSDNERLTEDRAEELARAMIRWMDRELNARENRRENEVHETLVCTRLWTMARRLQTRPDINLAYGPAGIGKTTALKAFAAEEPGVVMVTVDGDTVTKRTFCRLLFEALRRRASTTWRPGTTRVTVSSVAQMLTQSERVASRALVIVDLGLHTLQQDAVRAIVDIHDRSRCSFLLVGTKALSDRMSDDGDAETGQVSSRIGTRLHLSPEIYDLDGRRKPLFSVEDLRAIYRRAKIKFHPSALDAMLYAANQRTGRLRRLDRLVSWAESIARKRTSTPADQAVEIIEDDLFSAARLVEGEAEAAAFVAAARAARAERRGAAAAS